MLISKKKIIGAVMAGTLALGILGGTTAFAAGGVSPSLAAVPGVDVSAIAATARPGTATAVGKAEISGLENAATAPGVSLTAVPGTDLSKALADAVILPSSALTVAEGDNPIAGAENATTAPAK
ncbi:hypothetical protein SAMN02745823_03404 [Sporobacter termitidis DSM 10068]|uniref:Uncharacterized protein n=1 Tax=Sporobacter termitidis DSM 10068 TaxID=1123282 RepID=A0A1M5Z977_9FIRM|nr:hypothetical protein [Sporobacter termitidis]SHI20781.1 hypothetical protein SAMN02745823_03404 [Sporobacter termitidis DSM 10068]